MSDAFRWKKKNASANSLTLTWNRYGGASKYKVYYKFDSSSSYSSKTVCSTSTTLSKSGWKKCSAYVVALSGNGSTLAKSSTQTEKNSSSNSKPKQLATPTWKNVKASGNTITLEWNAVRNAASYTVLLPSKRRRRRRLRFEKNNEDKIFIQGNAGNDLRILRLRQLRQQRVFAFQPFRKEELSAGGQKIGAAGNRGVRRQVENGLHLLDE